MQHYFVVVKSISFPVANLFAASSISRSANALSSVPYEQTLDQAASSLHAKQPISTRSPKWQLRDQALHPGIKFDEMLFFWVLIVPDYRAFKRCRHSCRDFENCFRESGQHRHRIPKTLLWSGRFWTWIPAQRHCLTYKIWILKA